MENFMGIKRVNINCLESGMIVAEDVYNSVNQLIVPRDATITEKAIARLRFHSVYSVRVYDSVPTAEKAPVAAEDRQPSYFEKLRETEEFRNYSNDFSTTVSGFEISFLETLESEVLPDRAYLLNSIKSLLASCKTGIQVFDLIHCTRVSNDVVFAHMINVALICGVMGDWLNLNDADRDVLIECGIYHDIGKLLIPRSISEKPSALTDEEYALMKTHAMRGYNLLRNKELDARIKLSAMMHHERCNGSGYPLGISGDQIDEFAKIVSIADVYEAMTSPRTYRKPLSPFEVIHVFELEGLSQFDPKYVMTFLEHITQSYLGNQVRLNDGTIGTIIYINKLAYSRPMIQSGNEYIDLSRTSGKHIVGIL